MGPPLYIALHQAACSRSESCPFETSKQAAESMETTPWLKLERRTKSDERVHYHRVSERELIVIYSKRDETRARIDGAYLLSTCSEFYARRRDLFTNARLSRLYEILAPKPELSDFNGPSQKVKQIIACK